MSVLTAAHAVLEGAPGPLSGAALYSRMVERGLWENPHERPEATVAAAISSDIGRCGSASRFQTGDGRSFALRPEDGR